MRDSIQTPPPRTRDGALTAAEREALIADARARRTAWRVRGITHYQVTVAVGCFCPWPATPGVLEVRDGKIVSLRDTLGKSLGPPREPWSLYTIDSLFTLVEHAARTDDVVSVAYELRYDYPAMIRGIARIGLPDNWFWVSAKRLTPLR